MTGDDATWRDRPLGELSKRELIAVIEALARDQDAERREWKRRMEVLGEIRERRYAARPAR